MSEERKIALITGITGQDGSYLAEFLLEKGYTVRLSWNSLQFYWIGHCCSYLKCRNVFTILCF